MASIDEFIGSVELWPVNWAPHGWALCNGQLLSIASNQALYSIIKTYYGGDGKTTFALPDLRGRVPVGTGDQQVARNYPLGTRGGYEKWKILKSQLPVHTHQHETFWFHIKAASGIGSYSTDPGNNYPAVAPSGKKIYGPAPTDTKMAPCEITVTIEGTGKTDPAPIKLMKPYLVLNYIIALSGIYPQRP